MEAEAAAYAVLGLPPGAGPVAIETAYRRLIKIYHPDRGGDPARAAEINHAYQQLRRQFGQEFARRSGPPVPVPRRRPQAHRKRRWPLVLIVALAGAGALAANQRQALRATIGDFSLPVVQPWHSEADRPVRGVPVDLSEAPLDSTAIDRSVVDARRIAAEGEERLAQQSGACHRQLRRDPEPSKLDRCVAFDEAAIGLLGRDPFDGGPFGASAVTARHLAAGRLLSADSLAVESRLSQIRIQVELSLAPADPQPAAIRQRSD